MMAEVATAPVPVSVVLITHHSSWLAQTTEACRKLGCDTLGAVVDVEGRGLGGELTCARESADYVNTAFYDERGGVVQGCAALSYVPAYLFSFLPVSS